MKRVILLNIVLFYNTIFVFSNNIDSLINITENSSNEINKISALIKLSKIYKYDSTNVANDYARSALNLSNKIDNDTLIVNSINTLCPILLMQNDTIEVLDLYKKSVTICKNTDYKKGLGVTLNNLGSYYNKQNKLDSAKQYYLSAADIFEELKIYKTAAVAYNNAGIIYYKQANYEKSLYYFLKSLKIKETVLPNGQTVANDGELSASMVNLGLFYYKLNKNNEALKFLKKAVLKADAADNPNILCIAKTNIGIIYNAEQKYDSALFYLNDALKLAESMNNIQRKSTVFTSFAGVYTNLKKFDLAIDYLIKSLELHKQTNDVIGISIVENSIADLYFKQKKYSLAKEYGLKAFETAKKSKNIENQIKSSEMLSGIFEELNDFEKALYYKKYNIELKDSVNSINNENLIAEMQTKYETEKKNVEIKELKIKDIKNKKTKQLYLTIAGFLFFVSVIMIFFFRQKQKTNNILNNKNEELKQLNNTQNRLMSIISHDFKAPLSAFYSITSTLKNKIEIIDKNEIKEYLDRMQNSALGLKLQLENMLNWAISQSTKINVNKSSFNLSVLVYKTTVVLEEFAKEKNIKLKTKIDDNIEINTDGQLLSIVLNNLITNAIKFSHRNSDIEISAEKKDKTVLISVKDNGQGISKNDLKNLFLGKENNSADENKGTGLGLIVSKDIVEKLGGRIWAESELNKGTIFFIELNE